MERARQSRRGDFTVLAGVRKGPGKRWFLPWALKGSEANQAKRRL